MAFGGKLELLDFVYLCHLVASGWLLLDGFSATPIFIYRAFQNYRAKFKGAGYENNNCRNGLCGVGDRNLFC